MELCKAVRNTMSQCTIINKQFACRLGRSKIIRFLEDQHHWALDINKSEYICVIDNIIESVFDHKQ